jgi:hypothetical protein
MTRSSDFYGVGLQTVSNTFPPERYPIIISILKVSDIQIHINFYCVFSDSKTPVPNVAKLLCSTFI